MLNCKDFLGWLNEYLDETAGPEIRAELEQHCNACPNCWVIFDTTKKTVKIFKGMEAQDVPSPLHEKLMSAIASKAASKSC